jgi:hypothetical protein
MPTTTTTTFHHVSRIEFEYFPDASDPSFSFLRLLIYSPDSTIRTHQISFFSHNASSADHLHNIFLSLDWLRQSSLKKEEESTA